MSVTVTPAALDQMEKILLSTDNHTIRYELTGGGCGGFISRWEKYSEPAEEEGDQGDYSAFVQKKLKKYGVSSPAELSQEEKKKF